jgi:hypothetical protein
MSTSDSEVNNNAYLKEGMAWLRACLSARIPPPHPSEGLDNKRWRFGKSSEETTPFRAPLTTGEMKAARTAFDRAANARPAPALVELTSRFNLSSFEADVLLLAAAMEIDPDLPGMVAAALGDPSKRAPTFGLAIALFEGAAWDALSPERPLRALRLLEIHQAGVTPLLTAPLRIDERIAAYIKGLNYLDERLTNQSAAMIAPTALPLSQRAVADVLARWLASPSRGRLVQLVGTDDWSKKDVAATAARIANRKLLVITADFLPVGLDDADTFARLWSREGMLLPIVLLVIGMESERSSSEAAPNQPGLARRLQTLRNVAAPVLIACREVVAGLEDSVLLSIDPPSFEERQTLWRESLSRRSSQNPSLEDLRQLANEFNLSASRIESLAASAASMAQPSELISTVWRMCVAHTASALDGLAQRIVPRAKVVDLKLPALEMQQLRRLIEHAKHRASAVADYGFSEKSNRGLGIAALFHGESGAGKTMAAEIIATELSLALFRVDLSSLVSKWVGETAKNIRRCFDGAERGGAVLLFDEAEGVFGQRREAKDSLDRHANLDIDYLLTRMESFSGVVILATNMKHAIDPAFVRRLRYIVGFPFPGVAERKAIWMNVFPEAARATHLEFDRLARFPLTGGSIFNAALAAAHTAAAEHSGITMPHVLDAVRWEMRKIERPVSEQELHWEPPIEPGKPDEAA